jgi:hypothetical protein
MGHDFEPLSAKIIEAAIAVHRALGPGFLELCWDETKIHHESAKARKHENGHDRVALSFESRSYR